MLAGLHWPSFESEQPLGHNLRFAGPSTSDQLKVAGSVRDGCKLGLVSFMAVCIGRRVVAGWFPESRPATTQEISVSSIGWSLAMWLGATAMGASNTSSFRFHSSQCTLTDPKASCGNVTIVVIGGQ